MTNANTLAARAADPEDDCKRVPLAAGALALKGAAMTRKGLAGKRSGDLLGPIDQREGESLLAELFHPVAVDPECQMAGGEVAIVKAAVPADFPTRLAVDTARDPNMVSASATVERLRAAGDAGCLEIALDAAESIQARDSLERMLAHQLAAAHKSSMKLAGLLNTYADRSERADSQGRPISAREYSVEAARMANASARMMSAFQDGLITLARIRGGAAQTVTVQHVQVGNGGQAVVAGKVGAGAKSNRGRGRK